MKKLLSITLTTLLVLFASQAFGQSADVEVSAEVEGSLSIENQEDTQFGTIQAGQSHTISNEERTDDLGRVFIEGQANTTIFFNTEGSIDLEGPDGSEDIEATLSYYGATSNDIGQASTLENDDELSDDGEYYIFVGAFLDLPNDQANGTYSGNTTIEVSYTSF